MALTWGNVKTLVLSNLGKTSSGTVGGQTLSTLLPFWAELFQKRAQDDRQYWFLKAVAEMATSANQQIYDLPPGYGDDLVVYIRDTTTDKEGFIELHPISDVEIIRLYAPGNVTRLKAQPERYQIGAASLTYWPWPDKAYTMRAVYWKDIDAPVAASGDSFTNYWIEHYPELYVARLTEIGFRALQEKEDAAYWAAEALRILGDLRAQNVARELSGEMVLRPRADVYGTGFHQRGSKWFIDERS